MTSAKQTDVVRVAVIGGGPFAALAARAWGDVPGVELVRMADVTRFRELVEQANIDGVELLVDPAAHRELIELAFARGKYVAVHKPLAPDLDSARAIVAAEQKAGTKAVVFDPLLFHPFVPRAMAQLNDGQIGEVQMIRLKSHAGGQGGGGPALDPSRLSRPDHPLLLEWPFDKAALIEHFMGPVVEVFCYGAPHTRMVSYKFQGESRYGVHEVVYSPDLLVQSEAAPTDDSVEITGTDGILWLHNLTATMVEAPKLMLKRKDVVTIWDDRIEYDHSHVQAAMRAHFAEVIRGRAKPLHTLEQAERALSVNLASEQAMREASAKKVF
jgi:predicted dehydrogenase